MGGWVFGYWLGTIHQNTLLRDFSLKLQKLFCNLGTFIRLVILFHNVSNLKHVWGSLSFKFCYKFCYNICWTQDYLMLILKPTEITGVVLTSPPLPAPSHLTTHRFNHFHKDIWMGRAENRSRNSMIISKIQEQMQISATKCIIFFLFPSPPHLLWCQWLLQ